VPAPPTPAAPAPLLRPPGPLDRHMALSETARAQSFKIIPTHPSSSKRTRCELSGLSLYLNSDVRPGRAPGAGSAREAPRPGFLGEEEQARAVAALQAMVAEWCGVGGEDTEEAGLVAEGADGQGAADAPAFLLRPIKAILCVKVGCSARAGGAGRIAGPQRQRRRVRLWAGG